MKAEREEETLAAQTAAETWLEYVDAAEYEKSWDAASAYLKGVVPKASLAQSLNGVRTPLGKTVKRTLKSADYATSLPGAPDGEYVVITYETSFEHKQQAVETITPMKEHDGTWRVSGYFIK